MSPFARVYAGKLPVNFLEWQVESRRELFDRLLAGAEVRFMASHLPVVATRSAGERINLANKGVGLVPNEELVDFYIGLYRDALAGCEGRPWAETLAERVEVAKHLVQHPEHIDPTRLGSLEIFEGESFRNILTDPRVSLLYTGEGPGYLSLQIDVVAQIQKPGDPLYEFLVASRKLFEYEHFHIVQPRYPFAYAFSVRGVRDKTPKRRCSVSKQPPVGT
jgi:hypothetical protein